MYVSRAWMSVGRMVRLTHMLGLHTLDSGRSKNKDMSHEEWIELEEGRRTFWAAFYGDRWSSFGTGWPMVIQEDQVGRILTRLVDILTTPRS